MSLRNALGLLAALASSAAITLPPLAAAAPPTYSDAGPEPILVEVFDAIEQGNYDAALSRVEQLSKAYPNFRLAHLIRGDLLLARTRPLTAFGEGGGKGSAGKIADLRAEAVVRLNGYRTKPPKNYLPRYLMQMGPEQKYAIVVDTHKSRLYLYQNSKGTPQFVADYYFTQGKLGSDKFREGDQRTPIGVYHVTSSLPRKKLGDLYGSGAFPLNYPNEWDKRMGRNGHGIWLHGTPSDTFSRPPRASDGCVVLANQDLDAISKDLQIGLTPVIISNSIEWLSLDDWQSERSTLMKMIDEWRRDWETRDTDRYATHYAASFKGDGQNFSQWMAQKRKVNAGKRWIKVGIDNISMFRNPGKDEYVVVTFEQDYRSDNLANRMKKRQYWAKTDGQWKIIFEGAV